MRGLLFAALAVMLGLQGAFAAGPEFPPASRIGMVPPADMVVSRRFSGFENTDKAAFVIFTEMPRNAFEPFVSSLTDEALKPQGMKVSAREKLQVDGAPALLISGTLTQQIEGRKWILAVKGREVAGLIVVQIEGGVDGYSDEAIRRALTSVTFRPPVSLEEELSALPFRIRDKAGFRPIQVLGGSSVLMTEGPLDSPKALSQPILILALSLGPPPATARQRERFARAALVSNETIKDVVIERADTFRLKGQDWHEIVAKAVDGPSRQPIIVMQTIRFDQDRYVRLVGIARLDARAANLPRFRRVIDSIEMTP